MPQAAEALHPGGACLNHEVWNLLLDRPYADGGSEFSGRVAKDGEPALEDAGSRGQGFRETGVLGFFWGGGLGFFGFWGF